MDRFSSSMYPVSSRRLFWALPRAREWDRRLLLCGPQLGQDRTRVTLLSIYSVTRRRCSSLHGDALGTTVHGVSNLVCTIVTLNPSAYNKGLCTRLGNGSQNLPISELVLPSCTLFTRLGSLRSTITYRQLNFMCSVFIYRLGHAITKSHTSLRLVLALLCLSSPLRPQGLGQHARPAASNVFTQPHLLPMPPCLGIGGTPVLPGRTPTVHWGRYNGRPWVARHKRHKCEVKMQ